MKKKIAKMLVRAAKKTAYKTVGESFPLGIFEIKPPAELMRQRKNMKK